MTTFFLTSFYNILQIINNKHFLKIHAKQHMTNLLPNVTQFLAILDSFTLYLRLFHIIGNGRQNANQMQ